MIMNVFTFHHHSITCLSIDIVAYTRPERIFVEIGEFICAVVAAGAGGQAGQAAKGVEFSGSAAAG